MLQFRHDPEQKQQRKATRIKHQSVNDSKQPNSNLKQNQNTKKYK
jgi:hypothetical protein